MPWLKSEGKAPKNDKLWELSDAAYRLYDAGRHYAVENLTDGHVPLSRVSALTPKPATKTVIRELLRVRARRPLWHELPEICEDCSEQRARHHAQPLPRTGYLVHDFLVYNPSRTEYERDQERRRSAGRKGAETRWGDGSSHGMSHPDEMADRIAPAIAQAIAPAIAGANAKRPNRSSSPHGPYPVSRTPVPESDSSTYPSRQPVDPEPVDEPEGAALPARPRATGSVDPEVRGGARPGRGLRHVGEAMREGAR